MRCRSVRYENTPIQIYCKFHHQTKSENFQIKILIFFQISAQNIDCGYSLEPPHRGGSNEYPQSMFLRRKEKNNLYPCKPSFTLQKRGLRGQKYIDMFSRWVYIGNKRSGIAIGTIRFKPCKQRLFPCPVTSSVITADFCSILFHRSDIYWVNLNVISQNINRASQPSSSCI